MIDIDLKCKFQYNWAPCILSGNFALIEKGEENYFSNYSLIILQEWEREKAINVSNTLYYNWWWNWLCNLSHFPLCFGGCKCTFYSKLPMCSWIAIAVFAPVCVCKGFTGQMRKQYSECKGRTAPSPHSLALQLLVRYQE